VGSGGRVSTCSVEGVFDQIGCNLLQLLTKSLNSQESQVAESFNLLLFELLENAIDELHVYLSNAKQPISQRRRYRHLPRAVASWRGEGRRDDVQDERAGSWSRDVGSKAK